MLTCSEDGWICSEWMCCDNWIVGSVNFFVFVSSRSETMFYAPMVCLMFVGFRMRVLQLTKGSSPSWVFGRLLWGPAKRVSVYTYIYLYFTFVSLQSSGSYAFLSRGRQTLKTRFGMFLTAKRAKKYRKVQKTPCFHLPMWGGSKRQVTPILVTIATPYPG